MQHFYDGQIRRYITQMVRLMSNFSYKDSKGNLRTIPVMYGDITRQVGSILRDNSENKIPNAPRMAVYVTGLEMDTSRLSDSSYVNKVNIRERAYDAQGKEYLNKDGKNYTVERLMPTPYTLTCNADIWSTNTDQKLQILEQILMLFNPSLEIQTTDNYIDWTSLSVVNLESMTWSSRTIPQGTETEIDVSTLTFTTPIYISPPVKVKRLGVITNIITSVFDETGNINILNPPKAVLNEDGTYTLKNETDLSAEFSQNASAEADVRTRVAVLPDGEIEALKTTGKLTKGGADVVFGVSHNQHNLLVMNNTMQLVKNGVVGGEDWIAWLKASPDEFIPGVTEIRLKRKDIVNEISGTFAIDPSNSRVAIINWDLDTIPSDTIITGPSGNKNKIDYIIDPLKSNPTNLKVAGIRILLLGDIGDLITNVDGANAWKNGDGSDFEANANDIIEWDGSKWHVVFDSQNTKDFVYQTNLNTGIQYKWDTGEWILSFEGEYPNGSWRIQY